MELTQSRPVVTSDGGHKTRMICIRVSEVEFRLLREQYRAYGARSASDLARIALQRLMLGAEPPPRNTGAILASLTGRLTVLESQVSVLSDRIENHHQASQPGTSSVARLREEICFESGSSGTDTGAQL